MTSLPILPDFLEEHVWALRDRVEMLEASPLPQSAAATLAAVLDTVTAAAVALRGQTCVSRKAIASMVERARSLLAAIERDACAGRCPAEPRTAS
jgi:hypothetical protein